MVGSNPIGYRRGFLGLALGLGFGVRFNRGRRGRGLSMRHRSGFRIVQASPSKEVFLTERVNFLIFLLTEPPKQRRIDLCFQIFVSFSFLEGMAGRPFKIY